MYDYQYTAILRPINPPPKKRLAMAIFYFYYTLYSGRIYCIQIFIIH